MKKLILMTLMGLFVMSCSDNGGDDDTSESCDNPTAFQEIFVSQSEAEIEWSQTGASSFTIEYGATGFSLGAGQQLTATNRAATISNLLSATTYDYYIRANCSSSNTSEFVGPESFTTQSCEPVGQVFIEPFSITQNEAEVIWNVVSGNDFQVEYGPSAFTVGLGTVLNVSGSNFITLTGLTPATSYDVYVRTVCGSQLSEDSPVAQFMTEASCATPTDLNGSSNSNTIFIDWNPNNETSWEVEYGPVGFALGTGTVESTSNNVYQINGLPSNTTFEVYVRANCGSQGFSNYSEAIVLTTN